MNGLRFTTVVSAHLPELMDLWVESWSEVYAAVDFNERRAWFSNHLETWLAEGGIRLAVFDGRQGAMLGFILHKIDSGHLDQFCVSPSAKGMGIATQLMAEVKRLSPHGVHLSVNALNTRAIRFYEREAFLKTGDGINPHSGLLIFHYRWQP